MPYRILLDSSRHIHNREQLHLIPTIFCYDLHRFYILVVMAPTRHQVQPSSKSKSHIPLRVQCLQYLEHEYQKMKNEEYHQSIQYRIWYMSLQQQPKHRNRHCISRYCFRHFHNTSRSLHLHHPYGHLVRHQHNQDQKW